MTDRWPTENGDPWPIDHHWDQPGDPSPWRIVLEAEGMATNGRDLDDNPQWLIGATVIDLDDVLAARNGPRFDAQTFLTAAENRFHADGGLVGHYTQYRDRRGKSR